MNTEDAEVGVEKKKRRIVKVEKSATTAEVVDARSRIKSSQKPSSATETKSQTSLWSLAHEENEAMTRDPRKDLELQRAVCDKLRAAMAQIRSAKQDGASVDLEEVVKEGTLQFVSMKKLNRVGHLRNKKIRECTSEAKQSVDEKHLRLQNLLYEIMHLKKEVSKCVQFHSHDEDISLVELDQFYAEAPPELAQPELTRVDQHQLTLARLHWELEQRKRLSERLVKARRHKEEIAVEIEKKKEYLGSLKPKLTGIQQAMRPVQEFMNMPYEEVCEQYRVAGRLPSALYVLYVQAVAFRDAWDSKVTVTVQGDVEMADRDKEASPDSDKESDNNSDNEEDKEASNKAASSSTTKIKRRRRSDQHNTKALRRQQRLQRVHPLSVVINIPCHLDDSRQGSEGVSVELTLFYLTTLNVVTVSVILVGVERLGASNISGADLISSNTLLQSLYPSDTGVESPNPSNRFLMASIDAQSFLECVPASVGRPYRWVQEICGLQFPSVHDEDDIHTLGEYKVSKNPSRGIDEVIERIRTRVSVRLSLKTQLSSLERGSIVPVASGCRSVKVLSRLLEWKRSTYEDFTSHTCTHRAVELGLAREEDFYFTARVERASAKMEVLVVLAVDYPQVAPVFVLSVRWNGAERHAGNDEAVRSLEAEINIHTVEDLRSSGDRCAQRTDEGMDGLELMLSAQLDRLLMNLDVFLETEGRVGGVEGPAEIAREKMISRLYRGRDRARPYLYNHTMNFLQHR